MFQKLGDWIFHRALRIPHAITVKLAQRVKSSPERLEALNDVFAGIAADKAEQAARKAAQDALDK